MEFTLQQPTPGQFSAICQYIQAFELDNRNLQKEEFIVALYQDEILGFGRLRKHVDCVELCSLGVVTPHRMKGIGKGLVKALVESTAAPIYLVCIIPEFFSPFGFQQINTFPDAIKNKMNYCTQELVVSETYVTMQLMR
jgi:N-acetylglutamate synthase-like GNAT family acetyltransferase